MNHQKIIGILGGMGPAATADMFLKFIHSSQAKNDQSHIPLLISSLPDIPDRSAFLLNNGANPYPYMYEYTKKLVDAGANCIVIACNTAHYWFDQLQHDFPHITMLNMIDLAVQTAQKSGKQNIGILATNATLATGLYKNKIEQAKLNYIEPDDNIHVMESIYLYKAGEIARAIELMKIEQEKLFQKGAECLIMGCTEVPLILADDAKIKPQAYIDATQTLVETAIQWYHQNASSH